MTVKVNGQSGDRKLIETHVLSSNSEIGIYNLQDLFADTR